MAVSAKYDAFISYRHLDFDKKVAVKLQKMLESYTPPKTVVPKDDFKHFRVFRDETELSTSNSLSDSIREALRNTRYLIVVCSKGTAASRWCMEEITYFKSLHGGSTSHIRVIVIEGDPAEVMPAELLEEERTVALPGGETHTETVPVEPLALNIVAGSENKALQKLKVEYIRIAATLLEHDFEDLYQRNQRRLMRQALTVGLSVGALLLGIIVYGAVMLVYANRQRALAEENWQLAETQRTAAQENLEQARSLIASQALDYALDLNRQGARTRSAALLNQLVEVMDPGWENHDELQTKLRDGLLGAVYHNASAVYAAQELDEEVLDLLITPGEAEVAAVTAGAITFVETDTGRPVQAVTPPGGGAFTAAALHQNRLFAALTGGDLLVADVEGGGQAVYSGLFSKAPEVLCYREDIGALVAVESVLGDDADSEVLTLTVLPLAGEDFAPQTRRWQRFTLHSDVYGDISNRYSFSQNGRFLAVKDNVTIHREGEGRISFDVNDREITVLDLAKFSAGATREENLAAMTSIVDCSFGTGELYITSRFFVDNSGLLFLDLRTVLYYGGAEQGYLSGFTTDDERKWQLLVVVEAATGEIRYRGSPRPDDADDFYSSFVPVADSGGFLPYLSYNEAEKRATFHIYDFREDAAPEAASHSYQLPEGVFGFAEAMLVPVPEKSMEWIPFYHLSVNTINGNRAFYLWPFQETELETGAGRCTAAATDGNGRYFAGFKSGSMLQYSVFPSHDFVGGGYDDARHVLAFEGQVYQGDVATGILLENTERASLRILGYSDDRSRMFGYVRPFEESESTAGYYIWELEGGTVERSVEHADLTENRAYGDVFINGDFTRVAVCRRVTIPTFMALYKVIDLASGEVLHDYATTSRQSYFGFGRSPQELWLLSADSGVLQTVDIATGQVLKRAYLPAEEVRSISDKIYYNPELDYIIINNKIYSFACHSVVFEFDSIDSASSDCTEIYLYKNGARVGLKVDDLVKALKASDPPPVFEQDAAATGVDVLG